MKSVVMEKIRGQKEVDTSRYATPVRQNRTGEKRTLRGKFKDQGGNAGENAANMNWRREKGGRGGRTEGEEI